MIKKNLLIIIFLLIVGSLYSQQFTVSGTVVSSDDNLPMIGVTVVIEGTTKGTVTDFDGNFSIETETDTTILVLSYIGFETLSLPAKQVSGILYLHPETVGIEEVVITVPYGTQTKETFTGAVGVLQSKKIEKLPISSFEQSLQGNISGLLSASSSGQPGSGTQIRIRGVGSINAGSEPLYVLDGIPLNSAQYSRSSDDDETTTAEVSNLNILAGINPNDIESITVLKDAAATSLYGSRASNGVIMITTKQGKSGKTKFSFNTMQGITTLANTNLEMCTAEEYLEIREEALRNAGYTETEIARTLASDTSSTNWFDEVYNYGYYQTYQLSASGGSDKTTFYISGALRDETGIVVNTGLTKYSGRLNLNHYVSDKLQLGAKMAVSYTEQDVTSGEDQVTDPVVGAYILPPTASVYDEDGDYNFTYNSSTMYNVIGIADLDINQNQIKRVLSNYFINYNINDRISLKSIFNYDNVSVEEFTYIHPETPDGEVYNGRASLFSTDQSIISSSNTAKYNRKFKEEKHCLDFLAGYEIEYSTTDYLDIYAYDYPSEELYEIGLANSVDDIISNTEKSVLISYLSNLQYNIKNKYYFSAGLRRDGSSKFSENNKWGNFWSTGFSWRASDEAFLQDVKKINSLKLRGSVGTSGNSDFGNYRSLGLYEFGYDYNGESGSAPVQFENDSLTWEKNFNIDIGIDYRIFKRFAGSVELYRRYTYDLLMYVPVSATTGYSGRYENAGAMVNTGIEINLNAEVIQKKNFSWQTDFTFGLNKNKITELPDGDTIIVGSKIRAVGEALQTFYLAEWAGVNPADGSPMWYDEDGNLTSDYSEAAKIIAGTADPLFVSGLTNTLRYKRMSLSFLLYLSYGNMIYNSINQTLVNDGVNFNYNQSAEILDRWQEPGDITDVPRLEWNNSSSGNEMSTRYLEDGSYLRIKNITFSYLLDEKLISFLKLSSAKFYVQIQNLWTWTKFSGLDPEQNIKGVTRYNYPNVRTLAAGIDINF